MVKEFIILIPAYNEEVRILPFLAEIVAYNKLRGTIKKVIIVDDGSKDRTIERALRYQSKLPLEIIRHQRNAGKWAAIQTGLDSIERCGVLTVLLDADGSVSIWELDKMYYPKMGEAVFGSRFTKGAVVEGKSFLRGLISRGYRLYAKIFYHLAGGKNTIDDMQCPLKAIYVENVKRKMKVKRFAGDIEFALNLDAKIINHSVYFIHKRGSKLPFYAMFQMAIETIQVAWRNRFNK